MDNQETRSHAKLAASIIIVVVIGASLVGAAYVRAKSTPGSTSASTSTDQSTTIEPPTPCADSYPSQITNRTTLSNGTEVTQVEWPALLMSPGSTTAICVDYGSDTYSGPVRGSAFVWGSGGQQPAQDLNISASPPSISIGKGQSAVVEYSIAAGQGSTGFYGLSLSDTCIPVPLSVGHQPTQVNSTDFPGLFGVYNCPNYDLGAQIVGYTGASIAYLKTESKVNPTINITNVSVSSFPTSQGAENVTFRMSLQSFSFPLTAGLSMSQSIVRVFNGIPDLTTLPADDYCSWYPNNQNAVNDMTITEFLSLPSGFMQVDAPALQLATYSNATYSFSMLISGPIAMYTAVDPTLYAEVAGTVQGTYAIANYFPVSIAGQLQSISGSCAPDASTG